MTTNREQAIVTELQTIQAGFTPSVDEPEFTMFGLITRYNATGHNTELIGGDWAAAHGFNLPD